MLDSAESIQFEEDTAPIPRKLVELQAKGEVVFFAGAGVSMPAGLPLFWPLVDALWNELIGITRPRYIEADMNGGFLDRVVQYIDTNSVYGRGGVRRLIAKLVSNPVNDSLDKTIHEDLLKLSVAGGHQSRIVTTNWDQLFSQAWLRLYGDQSNAPRVYTPPAMPVPKRNWHGHVYIHGKVEVTDTATENDDIIISSGDFGRAYLIEQWAANFIKELISRHTICFVGYSLNDPILRYVADAIAADRAVGNAPREMYSFVGVHEGVESNRLRNEVHSEWQDKGVVPILYAYIKPQNQPQDHSELNRTVRAWACAAEGKLTYRKSVVDSYASIDPTFDEVSPNAWKTRLLLWALDEDSGLVADHFATIEPVPKLSWISYFYGRRVAEASLLQQDQRNLTTPRNAFIEDSKRVVESLDRVQRGLLDWFKKLLPHRSTVLYLAQSGNVVQLNLQLMLETVLKNRLLEEDVSQAYQLLLTSRSSTHINYNAALPNSFSFLDTGLPDAHRITAFYDELRWTAKIYPGVDDDSPLQILFERPPESAPETYATDIWKLHGSATGFLQQVTAIWIDNYSLLELYPLAESSDHSIEWNIRSYGELQAPDRDRDGPNILIPIKFALEQVSRVDQSYMKGMLWGWLQLPTSRLTRLAIWGHTLLDDLSASDLITTLSFGAPVSIVFDHYLRGEVHDLIIAKSSLLNLDIAYQVAFEDLIFRSDLSPENTVSLNCDTSKADRIRYILLTAAVQGGYLLSSDADIFMNNLRAQDETLAGDAVATISHPSLSFSLSAGDPPPTPFAEAANDRQLIKGLLISTAPSYYDDWSTIVSTDVAYALECLNQAWDKLNDNQRAIRFTSLISELQISSSDYDSSIISFIDRLKDNDSDDYVNQFLSFLLSRRDFVQEHYKWMFTTLDRVLSTDRKQSEYGYQAYQEREANMRFGFKILFLLIYDKPSVLRETEDFILGLTTYSKQNRDNHLLQLIRNELARRAGYVSRHMRMLYNLLLVPALSWKEEISICKDVYMHISPRLSLRVLSTILSHTHITFATLDPDFHIRFYRTAIEVWLNSNKMKSGHIRMRKLISDHLPSSAEYVTLAIAAKIRPPSSVENDSLWSLKYQPFFQYVFPITRSAKSLQSSVYLAQVCLNLSLLFQSAVFKLQHYFVPVPYDFHYGHPSHLLATLKLSSHPDTFPHATQCFIDCLFVDPRFRSTEAYINITQRIDKAAPFVPNENI